MPRHKSTESTRVAGAVPAGEPAFYPQEDFPRGILDGDFVRYDADTELWERQSALDFIAEFTASFSGGASYDQDLNTDDSPAFVTVKLSGLTDGRIPYHVNDATGLADGPLKSDVDDAVSKAHASGSDNQDLSGLVEKVAGYSLVADTEIAKIHALHADDQDLSGLVVKEAGKSLVADTEIAKIHAAGSDNQDLSGLVTKAATSPDPSGYLPEYDSAGNLIKSSKLASDVHAALTIDGTSPLSLSGQALSLMNDAAAAVTEVDTGTLDNSSTKIPANLSVYNAIGAKHVHNQTVTVKASGGDFTSIQSAIDFFVGKTVTGKNVIAIDPGTYDEQLVIEAINLNGDLKLIGDTRGLAGVSWVNGVVNYHTMANGGSGTFTITRGGAGNTVLTVAGSTTNPDFDADGWVSGDKVLVYTGTTPNTIVEMTLASVSNNTLTATGAWPDPAPATSGAGYTIALQPSVKIIPSAPSTYALLIRRIGKVTIQGIYIYHNTASIIAWFMDTALVLYSGVLTRGGDFAVAVLAGSDFNCPTGSARLTMMDSNAGIEIQAGSTANMPWAVLVKVNSNFGFFAGYMALLTIPYAIAVKCPIGFFAYAMSCIYAVSSQAIGCATSYSPTVGVDGNGNSFILT